MPLLSEPLLVREADSPGYTRYLFADPIGTTQGGAIVEVEIEGGESFVITLHGQREFDVPGKALSFKLV